MALWDDLVAYYKGGSAYDSWGKYDVSLTDVEIADGIGPTFSSWDFATSGSSDKAVVLETDKIPADTGIATVSMWFKGLQSGNGSGFVATNNNTLIRIVSDQLGIRVGSGTSCGYDVTPIRGLSTWTHLAVTADGAGNYEYYINGSNVGSIAGGDVWSDDIKRIGNFTGSDDEFADYITEFAFWSRVLTSDEIELIHSNGASGTRDLTRLIEPRQQMPGDKGSSAWINMSGNVLLWHLNDAGGGSEPDGSGDGHTGTPASVSNASGIMMHSASYSTSSAGTIFDNAANFNGSNSDIDAASATATALGINGNNSRTTMCWAKSDNWSNDDNLWAMGNSSTRQDWSLLARTNGFKLNTWSDDLTWDGMTSDEKDNWFHVAATYDGTTMRLYLNGTERETHTPGTLATADNYPLRVGNDHGYNGNPWDGLIQEFAMFDEALGAGDILSIYNTQNAFVSGAYGPSSGSVAVGAAFATVVHEGGTQAAVDSVFATVVHEGGTQAAVDSVFATVVHEGGTQAAVDSVFATVVHTTSSYLTVPNITGTVGETGSFSSTGSWGIDYYRWSWNSVPGTGSGVISGSFAFPDGGVNTWQCNMAGNTALYHCDGALTASAGSDSSGQGNTVSFSDITFNSDPYIGSGSWGFDGATSYVTSDGTLDGSGDWTVSFWLYDLASTSAWRAGLWSTTGDKYPIMVENGSNKLGYYSGGFQDSGAELTASDGWHNLVVVSNEDKDKVDYWIDGAKEGTVYTYLDAATISNIGNKPGTPYKFADRIDEFAFWTRALTDEEASQIHFLQSKTVMAASGNFNPTLEFVPELTGTYSISLEVYPGVTASATASIGSGFTDCNDTPGGSAYTNSCGWCVEGTTGKGADYGKEYCWDGSIICSASSGSVPIGSCPAGPDCDGVSGGSAYTNSCGLCVGGDTGRPADYGKHTCWDGSIICSASSGSVPIGSCPAGPDCDGVSGGSAYTNSCGTCVGGTTGRGEFWGMVTCWDGSLVCSPGECPIISGSATDYMIGSAYEIQNTRNATRQRSRRNFQIPFLFSNKTSLSVRKGPDTNFSGSY